MEIIKDSGGVSVGRQDFAPKDVYREKNASSIPELQKKPFSEESLARAVKQANELADVFGRTLKFEYRNEADLYQVSVLDTEKNEVVRKIPPDEIVHFIERVKDMFGAMLDLRA